MPKTENRGRILAALPATAREIAITTGIPLGIVRVHLSRAKNEGQVSVIGQAANNTRGSDPKVAYVYDRVQADD